MSGIQARNLGGGNGRASSPLPRSCRATYRKDRRVQRRYLLSEKEKFFARAPVLTCQACLAGVFNGIFHENAEAERLSLEFIQDRMATDDPIRGYFIRTNDEKQLLQGFIWYKGYLIRSSNLSSCCNASSGIQRAKAIFHMHKQE